MESETAMKKADVKSLEEQIKAILSGVDFSSAIAAYHVEEGQDDDGLEFLRVIFDLSDQADISDEKLEKLAESVEINLGELDERFASVRFTEAA
jgi:hypothetical protein